jgi:hypothetical protein
MVTSNARIRELQPRIAARLGSLSAIAIGKLNVRGTFYFLERDLSSMILHCGWNAYIVGFIGPTPTRSLMR